MGRLEDELERIEGEISALDPPGRLPRERYHELTGAALRGEEPEDLPAHEHELFEKILVYVPVIRELEAEGAFFEEEEGA